VFINAHYSVPGCFTALLSWYLLVKLSLLLWGFVVVHVINRLLHVYIVFINAHLSIPGCFTALLSWYLLVKLKCIAALMWIRSRACYKPVITCLYRVN